ncbi:MAG: Esterase/lipase [uncultured Paraburkholderia sp.]|nr:MAG: Esterase/lipase [uncultured Paraburkholderia sp.]CAH2910666.1 MAG: Esterase/lipase [uncultured Paraburkholderia sp.]
MSDEGDAYADKLRAFGNAVTLKRYPGMIHEFFKMGGFVSEVARARGCRRGIARGIRRGLKRRIRRWRAPR